MRFAVIVTELKALGKIAGPMGLGSLGSFGTMAFNVAFIGKALQDSGPDQSYYVFVSTIMTLVYFVIFGHTFGLDTIVSQGYGAKNFRRIREGIAHTACAVLVQIVTLLIPAAIIVVSLTHIVHKPHISHAAMICYAVIGRSLRVLTESLEKILVHVGAETKVLAASMATLVSTISVQAALLYCMAPGPERLHWILFVQICTLMIAPVVSVFLGLRYHPDFRRSIPTMDDLTNIWTVQKWKEYFALSFFAGLMILMEVSGFDLVSLLSVELSEVRNVAVSGIAMSLVVMTFVMPFGLVIAVTSLVGRHLGEGSPTGARQSAMTAYLMGLGIGLFDCTVLFLVRDNIGEYFSNDDFVIRASYDLVPVLACVHMADTLQCIGQGIFRGLGRPTVGAALTFVNLFLIGLPLSAGIGIGITDDVRGLWIGQAIGLACLGTSMMFWIFYYWEYHVDLGLAKIAESAQRDKLGLIDESGRESGGGGGDDDDDDLSPALPWWCDDGCFCPPCPCAR